jgi:hypothetical protein
MRQGRAILAPIEDNEVNFRRNHSVSPGEYYEHDHFFSLCKQGDKQRKQREDAHTDYLLCEQECLKALDWAMKEVIQEG